MWHYQRLDKLEKSMKKCEDMLSAVPLIPKSTKSSCDDIDHIGFMPQDYETSNWNFYEDALISDHKKRRRMRRSGESAGQVSDDEYEGSGGICPSCRLAVNKDTGRLKWCMGGNDIWRTRIRLMLLIPAVILPVAIVIIAISKSTAIGKLSLQSSQVTLGDGEGEGEGEGEGDAGALVPDINDFNNQLTMQNNMENFVSANKLLHPDVETSFIAPKPLIPSQNIRRLRRNMDQDESRQSGTIGATGTTGRSAKAVSKGRRSVAAEGRTLETEPKLQELAGTQVRGRRGRGLAGAKAVIGGEKSPVDAGDYDEDESESEEYEDQGEDEDEDEDENEEEEEEAEAEDDEEGEEEEGDKEELSEMSSSASLDFDDLSSFSEEDSDSLYFRNFWKGEWNEDFIRKTQAKMMLKYMDKTSDPCENFYDYACGNWEKYNPIPDDKAGFDTFETLRESLNVVLRQLLEDPVVKVTGSSEDNAIVKAKNLFRSCMNYEILEKREGKPLIKFMDRLGGWPILRQSWNPAKFDWLVLVAQLRLYNNNILISEWIGPDIKNSDIYIIQFDQTTLGLPTKEYFLEPSNKIYLMAYKNYLITIATLLGASTKAASIDAEEIIQFEIQLANITMSSDERRNISSLFLQIKFGELYEMIPEINWQRYLLIVLGRPVNFSEPIALYASNYLVKLVELLSKTSPRTIANYILWRFVRHRVNNLDDRFQEAKQEFYYILFGREKAPSRWKNCVSQVNSNMGMALGSMFVKKYFDEESKKDMTSMTHEIQRSFREMLNQSTWLDPITSRVASDKVESMQLRIGYPDFILDEQQLNDCYKHVSIHPDKYFENTQHLLRHMTRLQQSKLGTPVDKTLWNAAPAIVNAYYSRNKNQIMFPAGILQPPFYHRYLPRSLNYGGIGVVIGHEITHGFDDKGRLFDKYGNLHRWWSEESVDEFNERASCLVDQYSRYVVEEVSVNVDGLNTQGENIADNGGIKQAFRAYEQWLKWNDNANESLPGIDATGRQLFFLNFAQIWCGSMRPEAMRNKLQTDVHSPGKYRVIGTLSNSEDFAKVFDCPLGSPMNPEKKCSVW